MASREAIEYVSAHGYGIGNTIISTEKVAKIFDTGVEFEKRKHEWHNLEENPDDLPVYHKNVLVKYISRNTEHISVSFCSECNVWSHPLGL